MKTAAIIFAHAIVGWALGHFFFAKSNPSQNRDWRLDSGDVRKCNENRKASGCWQANHASDAMAQFGSNAGVRSKSDFRISPVDPTNCESTTALRATQIGVFGSDLSLLETLSEASLRKVCRHVGRGIENRLKSRPFRLESVWGIDQQNRNGSRLVTRAQTNPVSQIL